ncbi:MAG: thioredoxin-dependent thiol peroxidase [Nitrososphaerales archaeon]
MLKAGDKAPDFKLPSQDGKVVKLSDLRGKKVVVYFYVRDFTPGCTNQACSMRDGSDKLRSNGIVTLAISTDSIESHKKFADKYQLPFTVLSDEGAKVAKAYKVYGMKTFMGRKFMGVRRTTFLIDEKGRIIKVMPKVDVKHHADEVLEAFKAANSAS